MTAIAPRSRLAAALVVAGALVTGCIDVGLGGKTGPVPPTHLHVVDAASGIAPRPASAPPLAVRGFAGRARYDVRIVRRDGPDAIEYLEFERWTEPPTDAATDAVREALAASRAFQFVGRAADGADVDRWLDGYVLSFDLVRTPSGPWQAHCAMRLTLTERAGRALSSAVYEASKPLPGAAPEGLGPAMSAVLGEIVNHALDDWARAGLLRTEVPR